MSYQVTKVDFVPYPTQWRHFRSNKNGVIGSHIHKKGKRLLVLARQDAPVGSGNDGYPYVGGKLKSSMYMHYSSLWNPEVVVGASARYAYFVHEGTKPHTIRAKKGKALRFMHKGKIVYAHKVNHPGQVKPQKFLSNNLRKVM
jgi:hypothetical protein